MLRRLLHLVITKRGLEAAALFTVAASLLTGVLIARTLGPAGRGQIVVIATWGQALAWVGGLSIDKALIARSGGDGKRLTSVPVSAGLVLMLLIGLVTAVVSGFTASTLLQDQGLQVAMALVVLGTVASDARAAHILADQKWSYYALLRFLQPAIYLVGCAIALALSHSGDGEQISLIAFALCLSIWAPTALVGGWRRPCLRLPQRSHLREIAGFSSGYHVGSVLSFLASKIDLIVVSAFFGSADVGLYAVAASLGQLAAVFGSANLIRGLTGKTGRSGVDIGGFLAAAGMTVFIAMLAPWLLTTVYGSDFAPAGDIARILCVGGLLFYLRQGVNGQLAGQGRTWATAWTNGAGVAVFCVLIIFAHSVTHIALVSTVAAAVSAGLSVLFLHRHSARSQHNASSTRWLTSGLPTSSDPIDAPTSARPR